MHEFIRYPGTQKQQRNPSIEWTLWKKDPKHQTNCPETGLYFATPKTPRQFPKGRQQNKNQILPRMNRKIGKSQRSYTDPSPNPFTRNSARFVLGCFRYGWTSNRLLWIQICSKRLVGRLLDPSITVVEFCFKIYDQDLCPWGHWRPLERTSDVLNGNRRWHWNIRNEWRQNGLRLFCFKKSELPNPKTEQPLSLSKCRSELRRTRNHAWVSSKVKWQ